MNFLDLCKQIKSSCSAQQEGSDGARVILVLTAGELVNAVKIVVDSLGAGARLLFATASYIDDTIFWLVEIECGNQGYISLRVRTNNAVVIPSLRDFWPYIDWQEKEAHELFGIQFQAGMEAEPFLLRNSRVQFPHRRQ